MMKSIRKDLFIIPLLVRIACVCARSKHVLVFFPKRFRRVINAACRARLGTRAAIRQCATVASSRPRSEVAVQP